jgi:hypothetical protein
VSIAGDSSSKTVNYDKKVLYHPAQIWHCWQNARTGISSKKFQRNLLMEKDCQQISVIKTAFQPWKDEKKMFSKTFFPTFQKSLIARQKHEKLTSQITDISIEILLIWCLPQI